MTFAEKMRWLVTTILIATAALTSAQESKPDATEEPKGAEPKKEKSIFDEFDLKMPDFSHLPEDKEREAMLKWYEENVGSGIPKTYIRFMQRLEKEAKKPMKDSRYIGKWGSTPKSDPQLVLSEDGTFTWDYGHSKGVGIWREHSEGIIWIGFAHTEKDAKGEEKTWYASHFCSIKDNDTLVQNHIDYTDTYKRVVPVDAKGKSNGELDAAGQSATAE